MWQIIGSLAAACTMFAFFPQIYKVYRTKSIHDVSCATLIQLGIGVSLWIAYGVYRKDPIIIIANAVTLLSMGILLFLYVRYRSAR